MIQFKPSLQDKFIELRILIEKSGIDLDDPLTQSWYRYWLHHPMKVELVWKKDAFMLLTSNKARRSVVFYYYLVSGNIYIVSGTFFKTSTSRLAHKFALHYKREQKHLNLEKK